MRFQSYEDPLNREAVAEGSQAQARSAAAPGAYVNALQLWRSDRKPFHSAALPGLKPFSQAIQALRRFAPAPGYLLPPLRGSGTID
jgi:hypothetical protein